MEAKDEQMEEGAPHVMRGEGRSMWIFGELVTYKVTAEQTGGAYSLFEVMSRLEQGGPPPHVQHREDECFYVLEGEYEFLVAGRVLRAGTGSLLYVPRGHLHAHRNVGEGVGKMLVSQTPGGLHERFWEEIGEEGRGGSTRRIAEDPPSTERSARIAVEYVIEMPLPGRSYDGQEGITG